MDKSPFLKSDAKLLLFFELTKCFGYFFIFYLFCIDS